jgi:chromosome segregation ATPase
MPVTAVTQSFLDYEQLLSQSSSARTDIEETIAENHEQLNACIELEKSLTSYHNFFSEIPIETSRALRSQIHAAKKAIESASGELRDVESRIQHWNTRISAIALTRRDAQKHVKLSERAIQSRTAKDARFSDRSRSNLVKATEELELVSGSVFQLDHVVAELHSSLRSVSMRTCEVEQEHESVVGDVKSAELRQKKLVSRLQHTINSISQIQEQFRSQQLELEEQSNSAQPKDTALRTELQKVQSHRTSVHQAIVEGRQTKRQNRVNARAYLQLLDIQQQCIGAYSEHEELDREFRELKATELDAIDPVEHVFSAEASIVEEIQRDRCACSRSCRRSAGSRCRSTLICISRPPRKHTALALSKRFCVTCKGTFGSAQ